jgi:DNA-binding MarR family transcriptional regulator
MSGKDKPRYGPVPLRAARDLRLAALHFRVLLVIAAHDRLGKNGQGCWLAQNRIAEIVHCSKSHLSNVLGELRDWGFIKSKINRDRRWFRVHSVVYTDKDFSCLEPGKSVHPQRNRSDKSVSSPVNCLDKSVHSGGKISSPGEVNQFTSPPKRNNEINDVKNMTIVPTITRTIEGTAEVLRGPDRAEARHRGWSLAEAEKFLDDWEALAASSDRNYLKYERKQIAEIADDACLPAALNERAAKLLSQIPDADSK